MRRTRKIRSRGQTRFMIGDFLFGLRASSSLWEVMIRLAKSIDFFDFLLVVVFFLDDLALARGGPRTGL